MKFSFPKFAKEQVVKFVNRYVVELQSLAYKTYLWGESNAEPQRLIEMVYDSPTAMLCLDRLTSFIEGNGFADEETANFKVNPYQTANQLLSEIASYVAYFDGCAFLVRRDSLDASIISSTYNQPIDKVTRKLDGNFFINPQRVGEFYYQINRNKEIPAFIPGNPDDAIAEFGLPQPNNKLFHLKDGMIHYCYRKKPGAEHYPYPVWYAAESDIRSDAEYAKWEYEQVSNGFLPSAIITTRTMNDDVNVLIDPSTGKRYKDINGNDKKTELERFYDQINSLRGGGNRGGMVHLEWDNTEGRQIPVKVDLLNPMASAGDMTAKREGIAMSICRSFGLSPTLVGIQAQGGLGDTKQIVDEITLADSMAKKKQSMITEALTAIYPKMNWEISSFKPLQFIPDQVYAQMTVDEIRKVANLPPLEEGQTVVGSKPNEPVAKTLKLNETSYKTGS